MKSKGFTRSLLVAVIALLLLSSGAKAYDALWSGSAVITIGTSENSTQVDDGEDGGGVGGSAPAEISVVGVIPSSGAWDSDSKEWAVSILTGDTASLVVTLENTGGEAMTLLTYISDTTLAPGVTLSGLGGPVGWSTTGIVCSAGAMVDIPFIIEVDETAEAGTLPVIELMLGKYQ